MKKEIVYYRFEVQMKAKTRELAEINILRLLKGKIDCSIHYHGTVTKKEGE